jgi:hypothetical protein
MAPSQDAHDQNDAAWLADVALAAELQPIAAVLRALVARGLAQPAVASGFTRGIVLGAPPTDIDIHYVGAIPTATAEQWLAEIRADLGLTDGEWDIWNFQEHDPRITTTAYGYRVHFVSTIDCICLLPDGTLCDVTGRGVADARARRMHLTHLAVTDYPYRIGQLCYLYLEGCRRMALYDLAPTEASAAALRADAHLWARCPEPDRGYLVRRLRTKLTPAQRVAARPIYAAFGWDGIFDEVAG